MAWSRARLPGPGFRTTHANPRPVIATGRLASNRPHLTRRAIVLVGALIAVTAAGALTALDPTALAVACVVMLASIAIASPSARFAIVVAGGLLVFRSSGQLDAPKLAYLVWVGVCTAVAIAGLGAEREQGPIADIRSLLLASAALVGAVGLSLGVALFSGTPFVDWIRDAAPYGLLAVSPFLAWDGARSRLGSHMDVIAIAAGLMASIAFAVEWLGRRGLADLPFATLGSSSGMLSTLAFVVAVGAILSRRPWRFFWASVAATVLTLLLITGTRSVLVIVVGPVAMLFARGQRFTRVRRLAGGVFVVGLAALPLAFLALQSGLVDTAKLAERFGSLVALGSNLSADQSFIERSAQVGVASSAFMGSPVVGVGLGSTFESVRFGGEPFAAVNLDTGLSIAAKFGLLGLGLIGIALAAVLTFFRRLRIRLPEQVRLSVVGFAAVSVAFLPLGNPLEDKGFGLAMAILFAWALASAETAGTDPSTFAEAGESGGREEGSGGRPRFADHPLDQGTLDAPMMAATLGSRPSTRRE